MACLTNKELSVKNAGWSQTRRVTEKYKCLASESEQSFPVFIHNLISEYSVSYEVCPLTQ